MSLGPLFTAYCWCGCPRILHATDLGSFPDGKGPCNGGGYPPCNCDGYLYRNDAKGLEMQALADIEYHQELKGKDSTRVGERVRGRTRNAKNKRGLGGATTPHRSHFPRPAQTDRSNVNIHNPQGVVPAIASVAPSVERKVSRVTA